MLKATSPEAEAVLKSLEERRNAAAANALRVADEQIAGVRARGDAFVAEQVQRFDGVTLAAVDLLTTPSSGLRPPSPPPGGGEGPRRETSRAAESTVSSVSAPSFPTEPLRLRSGQAPADEGATTAIDAQLKQAVDLAISRIEAFHLPQLPASYRWGNVTHRVQPLRRVGIYVPGGRAVYLSTLIMCAVPARIAGVQELVVATTPAAAARPELQYVCERLGVREIYRAGGAAGIAALALGTESLGRVDKIVGPGNAYVTAAKARLVGEVGIDMTAGPTELVVIADDTASADYVIADLMAQAEHGDDSAVLCLTTSVELARKMPERAITFLCASIGEALAISNRIAPEHLSIQARDAAAIAERAENCGAIYVGPFSPPASGDYTVGSNHVLPTAGSARFFSPLGTYDFVKRSNIVSLDREELAEISGAAATLATFEGLPAHARSVRSRDEVPA